MALTDDTPIPDYAGMLSLRGRGVVVLGAGQGIGRQSAHAAAAAGAKVACVDVDIERARSVAEELEGTAHAADVTQADEMKRLASEVHVALGRVDALIDIIGMPRFGPILDMSDADWDFQQDICLKQAFLAMREFGRLMKADGGGAMAFVSSISGGRSSPGHAGYGAAKAGLISLIASAANEMGPHNIRVNGVAPGTTMTPRMTVTLPEEARAGAARRVPMQRLGEPSDIASALLFLVSDLSSYISGEVIRVDGAATTMHPVKMSATRTP